jgi:uncharacterized membrane protein
MFKVRNTTTYKVCLCFAYWDSTNQTWTSQGWWIVDPFENIVLYSEKLNESSIFYLYAYTHGHEGNSIVWYGEKPFHTKDDVFKIQDADKNCDSSCKKFVKVETGGNSTYIDYLTIRSNAELTMKNDLLGLEIKKQERRWLSGTNFFNKIYSFFNKIYIQNRSLVNTIMFFIIYMIGGFFCFLFLEWVESDDQRLTMFFNKYFHFNLVIILVCLCLAFSGFIFFIDDIYDILMNKNPLNKEVEKFNRVIKAIHINDQLENAGNSGATLEDREKVIEALQLLRDDLVRALKTERILRQNKKFFIESPTLFADNLAALVAVQVSNQATEQGRLLKEALEIGIAVKEEMNKLQSK